MWCGVCECCYLCPWRCGEVRGEHECLTLPFSALFPRDRASHWVWSWTGDSQSPVGSDSGPHSASGCKATDVFFFFLNMGLGDSAYLYSKHAHLLSSPVTPESALWGNSWKTIEHHWKDWPCCCSLDEDVLAWPPLSALSVSVLCSGEDWEAKEEEPDVPEGRTASLLWGKNFYFKERNGFSNPKFVDISPLSGKLPHYWVPLFI